MKQIHSQVVLRGTFLLALVSAGYGMSACGSSQANGGGGDNGGASFQFPDASLGNGNGGSLDTGGSVGAGGSDSTGGSSGSVGTGGTGAGGVATVDASACVVPAKLLPVDTLFKPCDKAQFPLCTNGLCVTTSLVPTASQSLLAACADGTSLCVPTYIAARNAKFIAPTCTSVNGAEGRCLSPCIPQIAAQANFLPQDVCDTGDLCAPCYDPRTGADTGACTQGCDTGPTQPAKTFDKCCSGNGSCVPKSLVPAADLTLLGADTCKAAGVLCAPNKLSDTTYKPPTCKSLGGLEGRCLADCIPQIAAEKSQLPKDICDTGELCAPCYDPISGADTGACKQNGDVPVNQPKTFDKCCSNLGHCVPTTALTSDQQSLLGKDTCSADGGDASLCAPDVFAEPGKTAPKCRALGSLNAEGRCIPACVPSIQSQKDRLDQGTPKTCADGTLCAPCYDPTSGADTGACSQNGDKPQEKKVTYPDCCGTLGSCVPSAFVPAAQSAQLGPDTCTGSNVLCAPKSLAGPGAKPPTCRAPGDIEARCLPACLPPIQKQASNLRQETCAAGELCADCYNPIDSTDTNACTINGDKPAEQPKPFTSCGSGRGLCVPTELVPDNLKTALPSCPSSGSTTYLCAPTEKVKDLNFKFPSCAPQIPPLAPDPTQPAACLPKYIIDFQAQTNTAAGLLGQSSCKTGEILRSLQEPTAAGCRHGRV